MDPALSIPEIRRHLCLFIRPSDYRACSLVSRAWFESIAPWIWHSATLCEKDSAEDLTILHKYRAFTRALKFELPIEIYGWFNNLQTLHCHNYNCGSESPEHIADLIRRNRSSLQRIHIDGLCDENSIVFRTSLECPSLKHLHFKQLRLRERDLIESFIKTCSRLVTLSLKDIEFEREALLMLKGQMFTSLEQLRMDCVKGPYLDFVRACPNLKALAVFKAAQVSAKEFVQVVTTHCKLLCALSYAHSDFDSIVEFEKLALILPPMKSLQIMFMIQFGFLQNISYSRHHETLQAVQMKDRFMRDGENIQTILSSCPNLRWFEGNIFFANAIEPGRPWVCQRLEHLQFDILVRNDDRRLNTAACAQLSQLKNLRTLILSMADRASRRDNQHRSLSLRLGEGLELLASLSKLEHFGVGNLRPEGREEWRAEDIEWMAQAWPNLEAIYDEYRGEDEAHPRRYKHMGISIVRQAFPRTNFIDFIDL